MTTTLANAQIELSKQIQDWWASTSTSAGAAGGTTIVDTALQAKQSDWIQYNAWDRITSGTYDGEERKISSLSTSTLTTLAHTGQIASSVTYEVHRLFTASEKRLALLWAARNCYPALFKRIRDEGRVIGNWLKDGSFEIWTSSSALTYWTKSGCTLTKTSTSPYYKHGSFSGKMDTAAGYIEQSYTDWDDLKRLAGKSITLTVQGRCDTASCLRIAIVSGSTITYSDYHAGDSAWTEDDDPMEVEATIGENPTNISFRLYHAVAAGTSYVDDARIMGDEYGKVYIGDLGFSQHEPHGVFVEAADYTKGEPWIRLHKWNVDHAGYLYVGDGYSDRTLRLEGIGYLDFLASGVASTAWAATIDIDQPQLDILVAKAAQYLCRMKIVPADTTGQIQKWQDALAYWEREYAVRTQKFGMVPPKATAIWS